MRVLVAMSGGADSTAAALLLKRAGHEVLGLHMAFHEESERSWLEAERAAAEVGVPIHRADLTKEFADLVVRCFVSEYVSGRTPSPCPRCNRFVKVTHLLSIAEQLGCERIATGHYARIVVEAGQPRLLRALDVRKDQSYFLFALTLEMLSRLLLPLGNFTKQHVRQLLREEGISVWTSEESQELCFVPGGDYKAFLMRCGVPSEPGPIVDLRGKVVGAHSGIFGYTVGQRRGLGVCGPEPYYVIRLDAQNNAVVIGTRQETLSQRVRVCSLNISDDTLPGLGDRFHVKVRSTSNPTPAAVLAIGPDCMELEFDEPQSGVAPGQAAVLYRGDLVVGGGWICS